MASHFQARISALFLCVFCCLYLASSQAPEDADESCRNKTSYDGMHVQPLMDTAHYLQLLPYDRGQGGVWQIRDIDNNDNVWFTASSRGCAAVTKVCDSENEHPDNWMITQHITRQVVLNSGVVTFPVVRVMFDSTCQSTSCDGLSLYLWETSVLDNTSAANTDNYHRIANIRSGVQNVTIPFSSVRHSGFYLGIRDTGTCVSVNRVLVYYTVCEASTVGLIRVNEEVFGSSSSSVQGECVGNSVPVNNSRPLLECTETGVWEDNSRCPHGGSQCEACVCRPGHRLETTETGELHCTACPVGMFSEGAGDDCKQCPDNSNTTQPGMAKCVCIENYYRTSSMEPSDACIKLPQGETASSGLSDMEMIGLVLGLFCGILVVAISFVLGLLLGKYLQKQRDYSMNQVKDIPEYASIGPPLPNGKSMVGVGHFQLSVSPEQSPVYDVPDTCRQQYIDSNDPNCLRSESNKGSFSTGKDGNRTLQSQEPIYHVLETTNNVMVDKMETQKGLVPTER